MAPAESLLCAKFECWKAWLMDIAVPRETKTEEHRVGLTPHAARELVRRGHRVCVQSGAGEGAGFTDATYVQAGAEIMPAADACYAAGELVVKVKEPQPQELELLRPGQTLFTYLHLAALPELTDALLEREIIGIGYETVSDAAGQLPLLAPMSEIAGRMATQAGATCLEKARGGSGLLLGGVPGIESARVLILGGGVVGSNAALIAMGMGAQVAIVDRSLPRLRELDRQFGSHLQTLYATDPTIEAEVARADLVVGAVLSPGARAPRLVTRDMLAHMRPGSALVDVAIDQGGCFETSRPTTHAAPTFVLDGIVHYCVANIPAAVPRTAAQALSHATLPYVQALADLGTGEALRGHASLRAGLNLYRGTLTCRAVADAQAKPWLSVDEIHF